MNVIYGAVSLDPTNRAKIYSPLGFMLPLFKYENFVLKSLYFRSRVGCRHQGERHYMKQMSELILPQCYCLNVIANPVVNIELHGFSDASEVAYIGCFFKVTSDK